MLALWFFVKYDAAENRRDRKVRQLSKFIKNKIPKTQIKNRPLLIAIFLLSSLFIQILLLGVVSAADDYPWPNANPNSLSPLRFNYRNCTDFVAWRLNEQE